MAYGTRRCHVNMRRISSDCNVLCDGQMAAFLERPNIRDALVSPPQRKWSRLLQLIASAFERDIELFGIVIDNRDGPVPAEIFFRQLDEVVVSIVPQSPARLGQRLWLPRLEEELALEIVELAVQISL